MIYNTENRIVIQKGWGYEDWIHNSEEYCGKKLCIYKNRKLSWHYHLVKKETFFVHSGKLLLFFSKEDCVEKNTLQCNDHEILKDIENPWFTISDINATQVVVLEPGDSFEVPQLLRHQMYGIEETVLFEFSTQHFEEDSIRILKGD